MGLFRSRRRRKIKARGRLTGLGGTTFRRRPTARPKVRQRTVKAKSRRGYKLTSRYNSPFMKRA